MISELRIERFKCYRDQRLKFCPLTVLAGTNGSGKSTVLQSLLLMRLCSESTTQEIPLNGPYGLKLGEAIDVLNRNSGSEDGIQFSFSRNGKTAGVICFAVREERARVLEWSTGRPKGEALPFEMPRRLFTFLSADRLGPQDAFAAHDLGIADVNVGWRGEAVAQVLVDTERERRSVSEQLIRMLPSGELAPTNVPRQSELWLSDVVRPVEVEAKGIPGTNVVTLRFKEPGFGGEWTRPANTGFGFSSALPIIVAGLSTPPGGIVIIENPETHLHPAAQSRIGAFLARLAASGVQVVLETHSDHVLNGIRRSVAVDSLIACGDVVIHFFDDELTSRLDSKVGVTTLDVRSNGDISDWPVRFFDQMETDLSVLARVRRGK